ncbi:C40 family peptidase [Ammoniphilus sp. YIM 78166]|uniref:C40 family peptidase n=1 Tax=Ammoniphilus sp. YIM 78166 TaxID=1644106 RepID=UPI001432289C|nr:C40 family peptidase [Ammoniphilus sp. YIM 78166]
MTVGVFRYSMMLSLVILLSSCGAGLQPHLGHHQPTVSSARLMVGEKLTFSEIQFRQDHRGERWIPLEEAAQSLDFTYTYDISDETFNMGYTDVVYRLEMDHKEAYSNGKPITLSTAPKTINQKPYITVKALEELWETQVAWNESSQRFVITPLSAPSAKGEVAVATVVAPTAKVNTKALVQYAKRYLGVPYQFGADPFPQSKRFDSSSYTRHVYARFGISLPRTARAQSALGVLVDKGNLQIGDLLYFYVPGPFQTNRIVGHVGMYIGNGQFIHTFGKPGVTLNTLDEQHWKNTYMFAKRFIVM